MKRMFKGRRPKAGIAVALRGALLTLSVAVAPAAFAQTSITDLTLPAIAVRTPSQNFVDGLAIAGNRIVITGQHGLIAYSDDEGKTWHQARVPVDVLLTAVAFANAKDGWAVGHMGVVLHTIDGGETWQKQIDGRQVDDLEVAAAQTADPALPTAALAARRAEVFENMGPDRPFLAVLAQTPQQAIVVGAYRMALRTTDGGKTWDDISLNILDPLSHNLYGITQIGNSIFIGAETGVAFSSTDDGCNFPQLTPTGDATLFGVVPTADGSVFAYGVAGAAYLSHDQGKTWQTINVGTNSDITAGLLLKSGVIVLASETGNLFVSYDNGQSFQQFSQTIPMLLTNLAQMADGNVVVTGSSGVKILPESDFKKP